MIASRSARPALLGAVLITAGGLAWLYWLPESARMSLSAAAVLNVLVALIFALTIVVFVLIYLGPYRNPGWLSPGFAGSLCLFGIAAFSAGEFIREAVRKPFVVYNVVLGNQVLPQAGARTAPDRLPGGRPAGPSAFVKEHYPQALVDGRIDGNLLLDLPPDARVVLGRVLFQYHCNDCHAASEGYSALGGLLQGRSRGLVYSRIEHLDAVLFMPPWCGTPQEAELLTDYLMTINPPRPGGMLIGTESRQEEK